MYQIQEDSLNRLIEAYRKLYHALQRSPFWLLIATDDDFLNFVSAISSVENQTRKEDGQTA